MKLLQHEPSRYVENHPSKRAFGPMRRQHPSSFPACCWCWRSSSIRCFLPFGSRCLSTGSCRGEITFIRPGKLQERSVRRLPLLVRLPEQFPVRAGDGAVHSAGRNAVCLPDQQPQVGADDLPRRLLSAGHHLVVIVSLVFQYMFNNSDRGLINYLLVDVLHVMDDYVPWLLREWSGNAAIWLMGIWKNVAGRCWSTSRHCREFLRSATRRQSWTARVCGKNSGILQCHL